MKKYTIVLGLALASTGMFAQGGLGGVKDAAKGIDVEKVSKEIVKEAAEGAKEKVDAAKEDMKGEMDAAKDKMEAAKEGLEGEIDATKEGMEGKVEDMKNEAEGAKENMEAMKDEKIAEAEAKRNEELEAISNDATKLEEKSTALKAELEEKEAIKAEKKESVLGKITTLKEKITAAETSLGLLEKSGISPEELAKKTAIIDNAKSKLSLLSSFM